jgi:hypothetical protein
MKITLKLNLKIIKGIDINENELLNFETFFIHSDI